MKNDNFLITILKAIIKIRKRVSHVIIKKKSHCFRNNSKKNLTVASYLVQGQGAFFGHTVAARRGIKAIAAVDVKNSSTRDNFVPLVTEHMPGLVKTSAAL